MIRTLCLLVLLLAGHARAAEPVNAVAGDASWELAFGGTPTDAAPESLRIATHLAWVEARLRARDVSGWPEALRAKRTGQLERLRAYREAGRYPHNTEFADRRPVFIDADGTHCAVGHLMALDGGPARLVDAAFHGATVAAMLAEPGTPLEAEARAALVEWVAQSGLTAEECALIQPAYGPVGTEGTLTDGAILGTGLWSAANGALGGLNLAAFGDGDPGLGWGLAGTLSGLAQATWGATKAPVLQYDCFGWGPCPVDDEAPAAWTNIGVGAFATVAGILRLTRGRAPRADAARFDLVPTPDGQGMALRFGTRF